MKIHEKLKSLLGERKLKLKALHRKIEELFGDKAIAYLTLYRTVHGLTKVRESSLFQIATALGLSPSDIKRGTEDDIEVDRYEYNRNAYYDVLTKDVEFLPMKLVLAPAARTLTEQDPAELGNFIKWVYPLQGEVTCVVTAENGTEKQVVKKTDKPFRFKSTYPHYFENNTSRRASCLIIQFPKYR